MASVEVQTITEPSLSEYMSQGPGQDINEIRRDIILNAAENLAGNEQQVDAAIESVSDENQRIIYPTPFKVSEHELSGQPSILPGKIEVSKDGKLFQMVVKVGQITGDLIQQFNQFIARLPVIIGNNPLKLDNDLILNFVTANHDNKTLFFPPTDLDNTTLLTPLMSEDKGLTYAGSLYGVAVLSKIVRDDYGEIMYNEYGQPTTKVIEQENIARLLVKIPIMVRSSTCALFRHENLRSLEMGTCYSDPGGYFIIKGGAKVLVGQEKLAVNRPLIYVKDGVDTLRFTSSTIHGTEIMLIKEVEQGKGDKKMQFIGFYSGFLGTDEKGKGTEHWINALMVYDLLYPPNAWSGYGYADKQNMMVTHILSFVDPSNWSKVNRVLLETLITYSIYIDPWASVAEAMKMSPDLPINIRNERIRAGLHETLFPQINAANVVGKLNLYSFCLARYLERLAGIRELDDRDSWLNKKVDSAAISMERLFSTCYKAMIRKITKSLNDNIAKGIKPDNIKAILSRGNWVREVNILSGDLEKAFNADSWGCRRSTRKENIAQALSRENNISMISHLQRTTAPTRQQTKQTSVRDVRSDQAVIMDTNQTPESGRLGLVKHRTAVCRYSVNSNYEAVAIICKGRYITERDSQNRNEYDTSLIINGYFLGFCKGSELRDYLVTKRRRGEIYRDVSIIYVIKDRVLYVLTEWGRPLAPFLVVNPETNKLVIDEENLWSSDFNTLIRRGAIEYMNPWEIRLSYVAQRHTEVDERIKSLQVIKSDVDKLLTEYQELEIRLDNLEPTDPSFQNAHRLMELAKENYENTNAAYVNDLNKRFYTHSLIHPLSIAGISASLIPMFNFIPGARGSYSCNHIGQAMGLKDSLMLLGGTTVRTMSMSKRPLVMTMTHDILGLDSLPQGATVRVGIMNYYGKNIEDGVIIRKGLIDLGGFPNTIYKTIVIKTKPSSGSGPITATEEFSMPVRKKDSDRYANIGDDGIIEEGSMVKMGDCLAGRLRRIKHKNTNTTREDDISYYAKIGEEGIVHEVIKDINPNTKTGQITVVLRMTTPPQVGDKYATRNAQKFTITYIAPDTDMPVLPNGEMLDIIISPFAVPSRMTMSLLYEMIMGNYAIATGERVNATAFEDFDLDKFQAMLTFYGFSSTGSYNLLNPITGRYTETKVFTGFNYLQALKHRISEKVQGVARAPISAIDKQPIGGRGKGGGLRYGEMDKDAVESHGTPYLNYDRMTENSDATVQAVCTKCKEYAVLDHNKGKYYCPVCKGYDEIGRVKMSASFILFCRMLSGQQILMKPVMERIEEK